MTNAIQVTELTKVYQTGKHKSPLRAVDGVSFDVREGEVFGFLGPNGAGKTTTIRMLTGLARPTAGRASVMGLDLATDLTRVKKRIGVVPETSNLYDELSAFDLLGGMVFGLTVTLVVPVDSMPLALQALARVLPLTYAVEALRAALIGGGLADAALDLLALAGFAVVLFALAVRVLARWVE